MRITQKDIARELGISFITVIRALNGTGYVSESLKKRILDLAKERTYVPHKASQALVRNKFRNMAVFSSSLPHYFWNDIGAGIAIAAEELLPFNYNIRYHIIQESDTASYLSSLKEEIERGLDAVAFVNQRLYDMKAIIAMVEAAGIPYVTFNVDAPKSRRICYIGSDYFAGGRLSADFIGKSLQVKRGGTVLAISVDEGSERFSKDPDINGERLGGFLSLMRERFPDVACEVRYITTKLREGYADSQIEDLLAEWEGAADAVYLIPAFNAAFLAALEKFDYRNAITVLHDIDGSAVHHLETHLLTAVIHQDPILQGYYTVKTMERILESRERPVRLNDIELVHNLILSENRNLLRNHYALMQLTE